MPTKYLDFNTVYMTDKQWEFCGKFYMEHSIPVSCVTQPALKTIRFTNLPKTYPNNAIVTCTGGNGNKADFEFIVRYSESYPSVHTCYGFRGNLTLSMEDFVCSQTTIFPIDKQGKDIVWAIKKAQPTRIGVVQIVQICINYAFVNYLCKVDKSCFDVEEKESFQKKKPLEPKKIASGKKKDRISVVYLYRTYSMKKNYDLSDKNPVIYKCRLWEVRGHERHYKDGRVVYVGPYLKGVDRLKDNAREKPLGKKYVLCGGDGLWD